MRKFYKEAEVKPPTYFDCGKMGHNRKWYLLHKLNDNVGIGYSQDDDEGNADKTQAIYFLTTQLPTRGYT